MGVLGDKMGKGVVRYWPPNELVLPFGGSYLCANFGENRSRNATVRVLAERQTDRRKPFFIALHVMQTRSSDGNSVCPTVRPSVHLSNAWIVTKLKKNQSRFLSYETSFSLILWENFGSTGLRWSEIADFEQINARNASAVTPGEKRSMNTIRESPLRAFQWA